MKIFLSPHNDDETLFGAFTIIREKPLVVICTDSYIQWERGDNITKQQRRFESEQAMDILGAKIEFLSIPDKYLSEEILKPILLGRFGKLDIEAVYAPAEEGGNSHHDIVSRVAKELFGDKLCQYCTYTKTEVRSRNGKEVVASESEYALKNEALRQYITQIQHPYTKPYFLTDNKEYIYET